MANFIIEDFKNAWNKENNGLIKIILINVIVFVSMSILEVFITLSGFGELFNLFLNKLMLPASLKVFIFQPWSIVTYFFLQPDKLTNYIPVSKSKDSELLITQFDNSVIESAGLNY